MGGVRAPGVRRGPGLPRSCGGASAAGGRGGPATGAAPGPDFQRIQTSTIVAHALLEGPALLGAVLFLLTGVTTLAWVALPVYGLGAALTWPQRDWFGAQGG